MFINIFNSAKAHIKGGKKYPEIDGIVTFKETPNGVLVTAKVNGLPQSKNSCTNRFFGFHIHEGNSCTGNQNDEFANAKSHLNPTDCPHPFHMGDLPSLIENNGYSYMSVLINKFKIKDIIGKVVIIHDMPDDFTTQPSRKFWNKNCLWQNYLLMLVPITIETALNTYTTAKEATFTYEVTSFFSFINIVFPKPPF